MNYQLFDQYEEGEINEKIRYWVESWDEYLDEIEKCSIDSYFCSPHIVFLQLLDEIQNNHLNNPNLKNYFIETISHFLKTDYVIKSNFKSDFTLIIKELSKENRLDYLKALCISILKDFQSGNYLNKNCERLNQILLDDSWNQDDDKKIVQLSQNIIIDFLLHGYSVKSIQSFPKRIFSKYQILKHGKEIVTTDFPIDFTWKKFETSDGVNQEAFNKAIIEKINTLTIPDRLDQLPHFFKASTKTGFFICQIEGLKGQHEDIDINIGNVNFYSPKLKHYCNTGVPIFLNKAYPDSFTKEDPTVQINAAIQIDFFDIETGADRAINQIDRALDILRLYISSELPFAADKNQYAIINDGERFCGSFTADKNQSPFKEINSFDLDDFMKNVGRDKKFLKDIQEKLFNTSEPSHPLTNKLISSIHWYRKGKESTNLEDKLVNYWIAIENLFTFESQSQNLISGSTKGNKFSVIINYLPEIESWAYIFQLYRTIWNYLYNDIRGYHRFGPLFPNHPFSKIPEEILKKCQLHPDQQTVQYSEFLHNLSELKPYMKSKKIIEKIEFMENFYHKNEFSKEVLLKRIFSNKNLLILIYYYRNLIVHNAHYDNRLLPYYVGKTENFASILLRHTLHEFVTSPNKTHEEIIINDKIKLDKILEKMINKEPVDLLKF